MIALMFAFSAIISLRFYSNTTATTEIYTLSLHDALPISADGTFRAGGVYRGRQDGIVTHPGRRRRRSEEHTSELQSQSNLVCRLLLEKKNIKLRKDSSNFLIFLQQSSSI